MGDQLKLDYYYGNEPDKFCFYRIPKVLFTKAYFEGLSTDAKVLYGLMLDMMASSRSNRWVDSENRVFIQFSIQRAMAYLGCGKDKAIKLFAELDTEKGIGLIERIDRGQGKADLIYVKSFEIPDDAEDSARIRKMKKKQQERTYGPSVHKSDVDNLSEMAGKTGCMGKPASPSDGKVVGKTDHMENWSPDGKVAGKTDYMKNPVCPPDGKVVGKTDHTGNPVCPPDKKAAGKIGQPEKPAAFLAQKVVEKTDRSDLPTSRSRKTRPLEVGFSDPNNTNYNNTDLIKDFPVLSCQCQTGKDLGSPGRHIDGSRPTRMTVTGTRQDRQDLKAAYIEVLRGQVRYADLSHEEAYCYEMDKVDGIINIVADLAATKPPDGVEWINSRPYSHEVVKGRLLKLDYETLTYVLGRLKENTTKIRNMRNYLLTALYNARDEMDITISSQVNYDMYGGGWEEKGIRKGGF